jgi:PAS domain S-box-containing protein
VIDDATAPIAGRRWTAAATAYTAAYVAVILPLSGSETARVWVGNIGLLIPPLLPIAVVLRRRRDWSGRALVFWGAVAAGAGLWFVGHVAWMEAELVRDHLLPWVEWPVAAKLCGGILPMVALIAWPHAAIRGASPLSIALDIGGIAVVSLFLFWSLILAPGLAPAAAPVAIHSLAVLGALLHAVLVGSFVYAARSAGPGEWRTVYRFCAFGTAAGALLLMPNVVTMMTGRYVTGSVGDIGWIVPFWYYARAAAEAPPSTDTAPSVDQWTGTPEAGLILLGAIVVAPLIGYVPRYLLPLGPPIDHYRDLATSLTLALCCGLAVVRVGVEQRGRRRADYRVWLLATACEQTAELIVVMRSEAIDYANHAFCCAFGYSLEELRLLPAISLVGDRSIATVSEIGETLRRGEIAHATMNLRRRDGTTFPASCTAAPMISASGRTAYFVGVVRDLTEELQLREQLVRSERLAAIGELAASVAHEINNPLQSVVGLADLMLTQPVAADTEADLRQIRADAERAGRIVRKLLTFVRRTCRDRELIDLNNVVREVADACAHDFARARIGVKSDYATGIPPVYANREELAQVVVALVRNAEEAMAEAQGCGTLTLRTYRSLSGLEAVLDVIDDGPGVPADVAYRIFEPFFTTKTRPRDTGLGLSAAFGIVASHGGALELVPTNRGACFRVTLAAARFAETRQASPVHQGY